LLRIILFSKAGFTLLDSKASASSYSPWHTQTPREMAIVVMLVGLIVALIVLFRGNLHTVVPGCVRARISQQPLNMARVVVARHVPKSPGYFGSSDKR